MINIFDFSTCCPLKTIHFVNIEIILYVFMLKPILQTLKSLTSLRLCSTTIAPPSVSQRVSSQRHLNRVCQNTFQLSIFQKNQTPVLLVFNGTTAHPQYQKKKKKEKNRTTLKRGVKIRKFSNALSMIVSRVID